MLIQKFLFILFFAAATYAQSVITGQVLDSKTKEPLIGVSVYINNSSIGKETDKNGNYELKTSLVNFEVVASMVGYKTDFKKVKILEGVPLKIDFYLLDETLEMPELEIKDSRSAEWYKNLELFKNSFLGTSSYSKLCKIVNEGDIYFKGSENDSLFIFSKNPLIVINEGLGYKIECNILLYKYTNSDDIYTYSYKMKFEDIAEMERKEEYSGIRSKAYHGSLKHFLSSLVNDSFSSTYVVTISDALNYYSEKIPINLRESIMLFNAVNFEFRLFFKNYLKVINKNDNNCSFLKLSREFTVVDYKGVLVNPLDIVVYGDWANDGIARTMPIDYQTIN